MSNPGHILDRFDPITLSEMDHVKLMDRSDTKYTFHLSQLEGLLQEAVPYYRVLCVAGRRISRYETLYYDTEGLDLYHRHHSGKLNRYKIRHRSYVESGQAFLEVKFKNNKGRTLKTRQQQEAPDLAPGAGFEFLRSQLPFCPGSLGPKVWVNYQRITLVNKSSAERLTIDLALEFRKGEERRGLDQLVIAEVKRDSKSLSPFVAILRKKHIREGAISKYCLAVASTFAAVKVNNFKHKLAQIHKLIQPL